MYTPLKTMCDVFDYANIVKKNCMLYKICITNFDRCNSHEQTKFLSNCIKF